MLFHPDDYKNSTEALDLYAVIEEMTQVQEVAPILYEKYLEKIEGIEFDSLLDLGCGGGDLLLGLSKVFPDKRLEGVDLSPMMIERARSKGVSAQVADICTLDSRYDIITAVFDMLNYIPPFKLKEFLSCINNRLNEGGYLICDINTLHGFEEISNGSLIVDEDDKFLAVDSYFDDGISRSHFTLFSRVEDDLYKKRSEDIKQFYHRPESISKNSSLKEIAREDIGLYSDEPDKILLVLKK